MGWLISPDTPLPLRNSIAQEQPAHPQSHTWAGVQDGGASENSPDPAVEREIFDDATKREGQTGEKPRRVRKRATTAKAHKEIAIKVKDRSQVIQYSKILITALEEVIEYDPTRHHNRQPPDLRIDDPDYLAEIRNLVAELRTLNSILQSTQRQPRKATRAIWNLSKHLDGFLNNYAKSLGKGAGYLTIGVIASLLYQAGLGQDVITNIFSHAKLPH